MNGELRLFDKKLFSYEFNVKKTLLRYFTVNVNESSRNFLPACFLHPLLNDFSSLSLSYVFLFIYGSSLERAIGSLKFASIYFGSAFFSVTLAKLLPTISFPVQGSSTTFPFQYTTDTSLPVSGALVPSTVIGLLAAGLNPGMLLLWCINVELLTPPWYSDHFTGDNFLSIDSEVDGKNNKNTGRDLNRIDNKETHEEAGDSPILEEEEGERPVNEDNNKDTDIPPAKSNFGFSLPGFIANSETASEAVRRFGFGFPWMNNPQSYAPPTVQGKEKEEIMSSSSGKVLDENSNSQQYNGERRDSAANILNGATAADIDIKYPLEVIPSSEWLWSLSLVGIFNILRILKYAKL